MGACRFPVRSQEGSVPSPVAMGCWWRAMGNRHVLTSLDHNPAMPTQDSSDQPRSRYRRLLRHPAERGEGSICLLILLAWIVGLIVGLASATESDLTGVMSAMTLLLVALLKNSERRAERAMQLKLDAIVSALLADRGSGTQRGNQN